MTSGHVIFIFQNNYCPESQRARTFAISISHPVKVIKSFLSLLQISKHHHSRIVNTHNSHIYNMQFNCNDTHKYFFITILFPWDVCVFLFIWKTAFKGEHTVSSSFNWKSRPIQSYVNFHQRIQSKQYLRDTRKFHILSNLVFGHRELHVCMKFHSDDPGWQTEALRFPGLGALQRCISRTLRSCVSPDAPALPPRLISVLMNTNHQQRKRQTIKVAVKIGFCLQTEVEAISKGIQHIWSAPLFTIWNKGEK